MNGKILEVCCYNIQSCMVAQRAGAARIELCADPSVGGTTPSYGTIQYAMANVSIPVFPMLRPRGGKYIFDADELAILKKDILICRELGCAGIATGVQMTDGRLDAATMKQIVEWAYPMAVTCHKVFDVTPDAFESLEVLIDAGCARVLTSGLQATAMEGATMIARLVARAAGRIIVMPGGGVRSGNIAQLARNTQAREYHSSGITTKNEINFSDVQEVCLMVEALSTP